jgi:3'-phosphoadenosine 5'-phosphosulfate sulfotransferase (PAPS reductase)/FAD synthetase
MPPSPAPSNPRPPPSWEVIDEVAATRVTERGATRADDRVTEAAMEDRKKEGYF